MQWYQLKVALSTALGVSQDALHIFVGIGLQVLVALITRRRLSHPWPWLVVLAFELANEWSDLSMESWPERDVQWGESLKDLCVTMLIPTLLMLLVRWAPSLFSAGRKPPIPPSGPRTALEKHAPSDARSGE